MENNVSKRLDANTNLFSKFMAWLSPWHFSFGIASNSNYEGHSKSNVNKSQIVGDLNIFIRREIEALVEVVHRFSRRGFGFSFNNKGFSSCLHYFLSPIGTYVRYICKFANKNMILKCKTCFLSLKRPKLFNREKHAFYRHHPVTYYIHRIHHVRLLLELINSVYIL